jgi:hypothetical protein
LPKNQPKILLIKKYGFQTDKAFQEAQDMGNSNKSGVDIGFERHPGVSR